MRHPLFSRGLNEVRSGQPFDWRFGGDDTNAAWGYERGRLFGCIAPINMPLRVEGKLNPRAVALFSAASDRGLIP
jgi:hypothetical protein